MIALRRPVVERRSVAMFVTFSASFAFGPMAIVDASTGDLTESAGLSGGGAS